MGCASAKRPPAALAPEVPTATATHPEGIPDDGVTPAGRTLKTSSDTTRSRELPLIPESDAPIMQQDENGSICSMTTVATPLSLPISHLESLALSSISAQVDRESLFGRSHGALSFCATTTCNEDDAKSLGNTSVPESRLDSHCYLDQMEKLAQDDAAAKRDRSTTNESMRGRGFAPTRL
mmetsp:Transcript_80667/g.231678  ORF Transcript_80667/g.231678 Transcript_80667/m.231678 type:complete len:180 (+) Transcript_80667:92-631(+)